MTAQTVRPFQAVKCFKAEKPILQFWEVNRVSDKMQDCFVEYKFPGVANEHSKFLTLKKAIEMC